MNKIRQDKKSNRAIRFPKARRLVLGLSILLAALVLMRLPMASGEGVFFAGGGAIDEMEFSMVEGTRLTSAIEGGIQRVFSTMNGSAYEPITVYAGIPVEWTLIAPEGSLNFCNETIMIPEYNLIVELQEGENLICFTPEQTGTVLFGCWMGMIRSSITVLDGKEASVAEQISAESSLLGLDEGEQDTFSGETCCQ